MSRLALGADFSRSSSGRPSRVMPWVPGWSPFPWISQLAYIFFAAARCSAEALPAFMPTVWMLVGVRVGFFVKKPHRHICPLRSFKPTGTELVKMRLYIAWALLYPEDCWPLQSVCFKSPGSSYSFTCCIFWSRCHQPRPIRMGI